MIGASNEISEYINGLPEDKKEIVKALRSIILSVDPSLNESLKWKQQFIQRKETYVTFFLLVAMLI